MVNVFQNPNWKQVYAVEINNKFEILENLDDEDSMDNNINEKRGNIKTIIMETKQQLIEKDEGIETFKNKWYDEECKFAMEEMKKAREKWLIKGRREKEEQECHHKRKEARRMMRNKKKTYTKNVIESIEEDQKHNNTRKMYQTVKQFKKGYRHKFGIIRNKKRELVMNTKEKAEMWKEYFDKLLNTEEPRELIKKGNKEISGVAVEELIIEDVKKEIRNLKNDKTAGTDGIHPELIKQGGNKLLNRLYELVRQIWEEKRIPEEWKETIIVPVLKRETEIGVRITGEQQWGNAAQRILLNIILGKIKPYIKKVFGDYQNGFRDGRSVIDNIFALKIINEKLWEFNQSVPYLLIDFRKAYDCIHRDSLWKCKKEFKIPTKLINVCKTCVKKTRSAVRIEGTLSSFFESKTDLKQGDPLPTILFNLALQKSDTKYKNGSQWYKDW